MNPEALAHLTAGRAPGQEEIFSQEPGWRTLQGLNFHYASCSHKSIQQAAAKWCLCRCVASVMSLPSLQSDCTKMQITLHDSITGFVHVFPFFLAPFFGPIGFLKFRDLRDGQHGCHLYCLDPCNVGSDPAAPIRPV